MAFELLFEWLGYHVPALGAFLVCLLVVAGWSFVVAKWTKRNANKRWIWDSEHNPKMIAQDIREGYERKIAVLEDRDTERQKRTEDVLVALYKLLKDMMDYFVDRSGR